MATDQDRIQKTIRKLRMFAQNLPKQPTPAEIHDLRTNARKLEAMFHALSLDSRNNEQQLIREVRRVRSAPVRSETWTCEPATLPGYTSTEKRTAK